MTSEDIIGCLHRKDVDPKTEDSVFEGDYRPTHRQLLNGGAYIDIFSRSVPSHFVFCCNLDSRARQIECSKRAFEGVASIRGPGVRQSLPISGPFLS